MLAKKLEGRLVKSIIEPYKAFEVSKAKGKILSMVASWYRKIEDGKELVDSAQFDFLVANDAKPMQIEVVYENGKFESKIEDLEKEIGKVEEEEKFLEKMKLKSDSEIIKALENEERIKEAFKKSKHLRLFSLSFILFDEEFNMPVWKATLKNWPLTDYYKREKPITIEALVNGISGKVVQIRKII